MTKEITKAHIIQELEDKFKLRELSPERFTFLESVMPVYNIEQHLLKREIDLTTVSITAGPAGYLFFTVPPAERWIISNFDIVFMTGTYTTTGIYYVRAASAVGGRSCYLDMVAGINISYSLLLNQPLVLDPGDAIWLYVDSYTATGDLRMYIDVTKEEIR